MAYNKHTWTTQELITSDKLNNIENALGNTIDNYTNEDVDGIKKIKGQLIVSNNKPPFTTIDDLRSNMYTYSGQWRIYGGSVSGLPAGIGSGTDWGILNVYSYNNKETDGYITLSGESQKLLYVGYVQQGNVSWNKVLTEDAAGNVSVGNLTINGTLSSK